MTIPNSVMNSLTEAFQPPERTVEEYAEAVTTLYNIARFVTSSGRCAAQLLLSGFNGDNWQLDITDLILLDRANFKTAMTYLECRTTLGEPQERIENGYEKFQELQKIWSKLHVDNMWKDECPKCFGDGEVLVNPEGDDYSTKPCTCCGGDGQIAHMGNF